MCLFNAEVEERDGEYHVTIPHQEVENGTIDLEKPYRIALIEQGASDPVVSQPDTTSPPTSEPQPPVEPGEVRYVEIEDIGKQGDGIARVERGYVIIVPGAEIGDQVKIEVSEVKSNFAVGEIIEEHIA